VLHFMQRDWNNAAKYWTQSTDLLIRRSRRGTETIGAALAGVGRSETEREGNRFRGLVKVVHRLAAADNAKAPHIADALFIAAQWAQSSQAAASLAKMSARLAKGDGILARLVRERQDLVSEWQMRDRALIEARSQREANRYSSAEATLSARLGAIDAR